MSLDRDGSRKFDGVKVTIIPAVACVASVSMANFDVLAARKLGQKCIFCSRPNFRAAKNIEICYGNACYAGYPCCEASDPWCFKNRTGIFDILDARIVVESKNEKARETFPLFHFRLVAHDLFVKEWKKYISSFLRNCWHAWESETWTWFYQTSWWRCNYHRESRFWKLTFWALTLVWANY